ncbi:MAG: hypothetical protein Q8P20_08730 [bacterium]|nr:hypothetical protein [bacterium]
MAELTKQEKTRELKRLIFLGVFIITIFSLIFGFLFVAGGIKEKDITDKTTFYNNLGLVGLAGVVVVFLWHTLKKGDNTVSYIWNPEDGFLPNVPFLRFNRSLLDTSIIGVIFFGAVGLAFALKNSTFFLSIPNVQQQVAESTKIFFGTEPAASFETIFIILVLTAGYINILGRLIKNRVLWRTLIWLTAPIVSGLVGVGLHLAVYGNQETALLFTFVFWYLSALMTVITGSFVLAYILHFMNNFLVGARAIFGSNDILRNVTIGVISTIIIILILIRIFKNRKRRIK